MSDNPKIIDTEAARVFTLSGLSFSIAIIRGSWAGYVKEIKADGGMFSNDVWVPITSISAIVRGETLAAMEQTHGGANPIDVGRMN